MLRDEIENAFEDYMSRVFPDSVKGNRAWKLDRQTYYAGFLAGIGFKQDGPERFFQPKVVAKSGKGKVVVNPPE